MTIPGDATAKACVNDLRYRLALQTVKNNLPPTALNVNALGELLGLSAMHGWNEALELAAMKIEKTTERSRIIDAGINGKTMQPCPYAAEIRRLKAEP